MSVKLDQSTARKIAEATWGGPVGTEYPCNRTGAFWMVTPQHGGLILDAAALSLEERDRISPLATAEHAQGAEVYILEEDEAWAIAFDRLGIGREKDMDRTDVAEEARRILSRWEAASAPPAPDFEP